MWGARPEQGPLALPGSYKVRVAVNGDTANAQTQSFNVTLDPRVHATPADLKKQFDLAMRVRDRVSEANQAVISVRAVRDQINDRLKTVSLSEARSSGNALNAKLTEVEEAIYQVRNRSNQDPLNFPIKLNNKIAHLMSVIEDADAAPTDQTYAAFDQLSKELDVQLAKLKTTLTTDLPAFNRILASANAQPVSAPASF
jgi:ribosome-associated translation inhibitor RaiA